MYACSPQEALRYFNQTTMQLQMLEFSQQHLQSDDEVSVKQQLEQVNSHQLKRHKGEGHMTPCSTANGQAVAAPHRPLLEVL